MYCHITENWRGRPSTSQELIAMLMARTSLPARLRIRAELHTAAHPLGLTVTDEPMQDLACDVAAFQSKDWYDVIKPRSTAER
jgi:DsbC/DsbD-like thiol-disulfide interchange protein